MKTTPTDTELAPLRAQIDAIDENIIRLLHERTEIVGKIGHLKSKTTPDLCPIRPGREAEMVRRIVKKFEGSKFAATAAAAIWRNLIGASTATESEMRISAFTPERNDMLYWMAREYFSPAVPIIRQPHVKRVIGDLIDGKASVGIVPALSSGDTTYWWTNLVQPGNNLPKIFARLPFVSSEHGKDVPSALAIGCITPEASGDDVSIIMIEAEHNTSQHRLQSAFAQSKLQANWVSIATISPATRHHLLEIKGFITPEHTDMNELLASLGSAIVNVGYLGAYATPVLLGNASSTSSAGSHVAAKA